VFSVLVLLGVLVVHLLSSIPRPAQ